MDIDQRIEALTQNVELLAQMHQDNEKIYMCLFKQLGDIAESHEDRITDLDEHRDTN